MVKYKKLVKNLKAVQKWFDSLLERDKVSLTRLRSIKQRTAYDNTRK